MSIKKKKNNSDDQSKKHSDVSQCTYVVESPEAIKQVLLRLVQSGTFSNLQWHNTKCIFIREEGQRNNGLCLMKNWKDVAPNHYL